MEREGSVTPAILMMIVVIIVVSIAGYFIREKFSGLQPVVFPQATSTSVIVGSCDIGTTDFTNRQIDTDHFGMLNFRNGAYTQNDVLGNADWGFTLSTSSSLYSFGPDTVRIVNIWADHLSGSGSWFMAVGYTCSGSQIKKVLEQSSLAPIVITQNGNTLSVTTWQTYEGAAALQGKTTTQFKWMDGTLFNTQK